MKVLWPGFNISFITKLPTKITLTHASKQDTLFMRFTRFNNNPRDLHLG